MDFEEEYFIGEIRKTQFLTDDLKKTAEMVLDIIQRLPTVPYVFVGMRIQLMHHLSKVECWEDFVPLMKKVDEAERLGAISVCVGDLGKRGTTIAIAPLSSSIRTELDPRQRAHSLAPEGSDPPRRAHSNAASAEDPTTLLPAPTHSIAAAPPESVPISLDPSVVIKYDLLTNI